jgi:hypothetical protein
MGEGSMQTTPGEERAAPAFRLGVLIGRFERGIGLATTSR